MTDEEQPLSVAIIQQDIVEIVNNKEIFINVTPLVEKVFVPQKEIRIILRNVVFDYPSLAFSNTVNLNEEIINDILSIDGRSDNSFSLNFTSSSTSLSDRSITPQNYSSGSSSSSTCLSSSTSDSSSDRERYRCITIKRKKMLTRSRLKALNESENEKRLPIFVFQKRKSMRRASEQSERIIRKSATKKRSNRLSMSVSSIDLSNESSGDDFKKVCVSNKKVANTSNSYKKTVSSPVAVKQINKPKTPIRVQNTKNLEETINKIKANTKKKSSEDESPAFNIKLDVVTNKGRGCKAICCSKIILHPPTPIIGNKNKSGKVTQLIDPLNQRQAKRSRAKSYPAPSDFEDLLNDNILSLPDLMDTQLQLPINNIDTTQQTSSEPVKSSGKVKALSSFDSAARNLNKPIQSIPAPKLNTKQKRKYKASAAKEPALKRGRRKKDTEDQVNVCKIPLSKIHRVPNVLHLKIIPPVSKTIKKIDTKSIITTAQEQPKNDSNKPAVSTITTTETIMKGCVESYKNNQLVDNIGNSAIDSFQTWIDENFDTNEYEETINSLKNDLVLDANIHNVEPVRQITSEIPNHTELQYPMNIVQQLIPDLQTPTNLELSSSYVTTNITMDQQLTPYINDDYSILDLSSKPYSTCFIQNQMAYPTQPPEDIPDDDGVLDLSFKPRPATTLNNNFTKENLQQLPSEPVPAFAPLDLSVPILSTQRSQTEYLDTSSIEHNRAPFDAPTYENTSNDVYVRSKKSTIDLSTYKKRIFANNNGTITIKKPVSPQLFGLQTNPIESNTLYSTNVTSTVVSNSNTITNSQSVMRNHHNLEKGPSPTNIVNNTMINTPVEGRHNNTVNYSPPLPLANKITIVVNNNKNKMNKNDHDNSLTEMKTSQNNRTDEQESEKDSDEISLSTSPLSFTSNQGDHDIEANELDGMNTIVQHQVKMQTPLVSPINDKSCDMDIESNRTSKIPQLMSLVTTKPENFKDLHMIKRVVVNSQAMVTSSNLQHPEPQQSQTNNFVQYPYQQNNNHQHFNQHLNQQPQNHQILNNQNQLNSLPDYQQQLLKYQQHQNNQQLQQQQQLTSSNIPRLGLFSPPRDLISCNNRPVICYNTSPPLYNNNDCANVDLDDPIKIKNYVRRIFGSLCNAFLYSECLKLNCKFLHKLLEPEKIMKELENKPIFIIEQAYRYILSLDKLFIAYFPIFCELYGRNQQVHSLTIMIRHCESINRPISLYNNIIDGLLIASLSRTQAVEMLLKNMRSKSLKAYYVIVDILLESDVTAFLPTIEMLLKEPGFVFPIKHFNHLLEISRNCRHPELIRILLKAVTVAPTEYSSKLDATKLTDFLQMVREMNAPKTPSA